MGVFAPLVMFSVGFKVITMHPKARDGNGLHLRTPKPKPSGCRMYMAHMKTLKVVSDFKSKAIHQSVQDVNTTMLFIHVA